MEYNPATQMVTFEAVCLDCEEDAEDDKTIIGFVASLPCNQWEEIAPEEDDPILN